MNLSIPLTAILALLGAVDSGYLIWKRKRKEHLVCPMNMKCEKVTESKWGRIFYFRNDLLGLAYYLIIFLGVFMIEDYNILRWLFYLSFVGLLFSFFLVYIQKFSLCACRTI